jgi:hypothetical protein
MIYSHLGKNNDMLTRHSHFWLFARVWNQKFFPSQNRNDLFTLGKKTTCSRATVIFDSLCVCVCMKPKIFVSQVWINDFYSHLGKKTMTCSRHGHFWLFVCVRVKPKIFPLSLNRNDLFTLGEKNGITCATVIFDSVRVRETKNFSPKSE